MAERIYTPDELRRLAKVGQLAELSLDPNVSKLGANWSERAQKSLTEDERLAQTQGYQDEQVQYWKDQLTDRQTERDWRSGEGELDRTLAERLKRLGLKPTGNSIGANGEPVFEYKTEGQRKMAGAISDFVANAPVTKDLGWFAEGAISGTAERFGQAVNPGVFGSVVPEAMQKRQSAWMAIAMPIVRAEGGQNLTPSETEKAALTMIPTPGESLETQQQKAQVLLQKYRSGLSQLPEDAQKHYGEKLGALEQSLGWGSQPTTQAPESNTVRRGQIVDGYQFIGGDPNNPDNWEEATNTTGQHGRNRR